MMKRNQKGFTITELVIVIAVIAILAAVLIPTFSGIIDKANKSAAMQKVAAAYKEAFAIALSDDGVVADGDTETVNGFTFTFSNGGVDATVTAPADFGYEPITVSGGKVLLSGVNPPAPGGNNQPQTVPVTGVTLNETALNLTVGDTAVLTATVAPADATDKTVTWTVAPEGVVTVNNGTVTAVSAGTATVTATAGDQTATCAVTVEAQVVAHTVTKNATNATITGADTVTEGASYTATIAAKLNHDIASVTVAMGGTDITATAYSNGTVTIASVTGDIVITVTATEKIPYNFSAPTGGDWYEGGGYRCRTGGAVTAHSARPELLVTNKFAVQAGDIVYVTNLELSDDIYSAWYNTTTGGPFVMAMQPPAATPSAFTAEGIVENITVSGNVTHFTVVRSDVVFLRLCGKITDGNTNQNIEIHILRNGEWVTAG